MSKISIRQIYVGKELLEDLPNEKHKRATYLPREGHEPRSINPHTCTFKKHSLLLRCPPDRIASSGLTPGPVTCDLERHVSFDDDIMLTSNQTQLMGEIQVHDSETPFKTVELLNGRWRWRGRGGRKSAAALPAPAMTPPVHTTTYAGCRRGDAGRLIGTGRLVGTNDRIVDCGDTVLGYVVSVGGDGGSQSRQFDVPQSLSHYDQRG
ncbi:hypothetical protein F5Y18DRAFT_428445 [Xylariaceae sp. FL1019]|nr:hypothetical protein F5Y18DRAFT_428445 [Xylariaceae sp. FL1019]